MARLVVLSRIGGLADAVHRVSCVQTCATYTRVCADALKALSTAEVALADPALLAEALARCQAPRLKWVQSTFAGVNQLVAMPKPAWALTRLAGVFGPQMAEYCLYHIINRERHFSDLAAAQQQKQWQADSYSYRAVANLKVSVMGLGNIGAAIASSLRALGCENISGLVTDASGRSEAEQLFSNLSEFLKADSDYIINTLPSTRATVGMLNDSMFSNCSKSSPVFINIGRGDICTEAALLQALREKWLSGAVLDVFEQEPLSSSSPLWSMPGVSISPHVAAKSTAESVAGAFLQNWQRYEQSETLLHEVDWVKGY